MDRVKVLYSNLSNSEKKALRHYLDSFNLKGENKSMDLLRLIDESPDITHEAASEKLYADPRSKAFIMMKSRLYEKMTEFLPLTINPDANRREKESPYYPIDLIEFRKCMLTATLLVERRMGALALEYFERARKLAASSNCPELEVDVLFRLRGLDGRDMNRFEDLSIQLKRSLTQQECDINATGLYRKWYVLHSMRVAGDDDKLAFLEAHIPDLEESIRQTYSPRADYFLQMLKVNYCYITREYEEGKRVCHKAIAILKENAGIRNAVRMSDPWFQLGKLELHFRHYAAATEALEKARSYHPSDSMAYLSTSTIMLYALVYSQAIAEASTLIDTIAPYLENRLRQNAPTLPGIFTYLRCCVLYLQGQTHQAWVLIQEIQELNFDKEGWITGIRLFEVMLLIEKRDRDFASLKLESLRKHMARYASDERMRIFYRLLAAQERQDFRFNEVQDEKVALAKLQDEYEWDPVGHEVIRFDEWYLKMRENPRDKKE
jgi:tetratricopeptide (TPR) repeat protein